MKSTVIRGLIALCCATLGCSNPPAECEPSCDGAQCGDDGCGGSCGSCEAGEQCVGALCTTCGNGVLDPGETCDPSAGSDCPKREWCESSDACYSAEYRGSEETCDAECTTVTIVECASDDGCCPAGCNPGNDADCAPDHCGNGVLDIGESCDPPDFPCETSCEPTHACEKAEFWGFEVACSLECKRAPIVSCSLTADGCCPDGCSSANDADCAPAVCGDGQVTDNERCDTQIPWPQPGSCSPDCDDNRACTTDLMSGSPAMCDVVCTHAYSTACIDGDGCCPHTCLGQDSDCDNVVCGDGIVDGTEQCDSAIPAGEPGACPTDVAQCDDGDPCTMDELVGEPGDCSARCVNRERDCADGDSCCSSTCTPSNDSDCADLSLCDAYCFDAMRYCVEENALYADRDACVAACRNMQVGRAGDSAGDSIQCRISHLADARTDPETHCPHSAEVPPDGCNP